MSLAAHVLAMTIATQTPSFTSSISRVIRRATAEPFQSFYDDTCARAFLAEKLILSVEMQMVQPPTARELADLIREIADAQEDTSKAHFPHDVSPLATQMRTVARRIEVVARVAAAGMAPATAA